MDFSNNSRVLSLHISMILEHTIGIQGLLEWNMFNGNNSFLSEKRRIPAWCDRILYWIRDKNVRIEQITYTSAENGIFILLD